MIAEMVFARVVELVDTQVSEACVERHAGSSPVPGTMLNDSKLCITRFHVGAMVLLALLAKISILDGF